jgi:vacuolar-type H+-ATPase subunit E/Vma4
LHACALTALGRPPQLNKEKQQRRAWAVHNKQQEVFDESTQEFQQLDALRNTLENLTAEPSRTGKTEVSEAQQPSRRKQLKMLRDEMRSTLANVDKKLETIDKDSAVEDPMLEQAIAAAKERLKLPPHLRGSAVLNETL